MAHESISGIKFQTITKGDLPYYSYIFRKPESFGTEMNNVAYSRLGTMLYLDIKKGKEATKKVKFKQLIRGTAYFTKRKMMAKNGVSSLCQ